MKSSTVSVIIPSYNMGATIEMAIESVVGQSYSPIEVIVVDDGSVDDTERRVSEYPLEYYFQENRGRAAALNVGIEKTQGEYVAVLDADDTLTVDSVERRVHFLNENNCLDAVFGDTNYIDASGSAYHVRRPGFFETQEELAWRFLGGLQSPFSLATTLYRKETFSKIGLFDETLRRSDDIDMAIRLLYTCSVGYLPEAVYNYHVDTHSLSKRLKHRQISFQERLKIIDKHFEGVGRAELVLRTAGVEFLKMGYEMVSKRR